MLSNWICDSPQTKCGSSSGKTNDADPNLDLCNTPTNHGSSAKITNIGQQGITPAVATVKLAEDDTATLSPGWYHATLAFIDCIQILGSATGDRGKAS